MTKIYSTSCNKTELQCSQQHVWTATSCCSKSHGSKHHTHQCRCGSPGPAYGISKNLHPGRLSRPCSAGSCAVVCAPTSSGKTFISSYVIQQVLKPQGSASASASAATQAVAPSLRSSKTARNPAPCTAAGDAQSDAAAGQLAAAAGAASAGPTSEGVVVIVLPTKALVNQLAAQVRLRYVDSISNCWYKGCPALQQCDM